MKKTGMVSCCLAAVMLLAGLVPARVFGAVVDAGGTAAVETGAVLEYWCMWEVDEARGLVVAEAVKAFTKATGVDVQVYYLGRDVANVLLPALKAGEVADVFDADAAHVVNNLGDYLLPLEHYVSATYADTGDKPYGGTQNQLFWQFAGGLEAARGFGEAGAHIVPYAPVVFAMTANRDILKLAGYEEYPQTWDEFMAICKTLKAAGLVPMTVDDVYLPALFYATLSMLAGGEECSRIIAEGDYAASAVAKACALWGEVTSHNYITKAAAENKYPAGMLGTMAGGGAVFYFGPSTFTAEAHGRDNGFQWGRFALPGKTAGEPYALFGAASAFGIHKNTAAPNAAFAFVRFMTTGEWDATFAANSYGIPMASSVWPEKPDGEQAVVEGAEACYPLPTGNAANAIKAGFLQMIAGEIDAAGFAALLAG